MDQVNGSETRVSELGEDSVKNEVHGENIENKPRKGPAEVAAKQDKENKQIDEIKNCFECNRSLAETPQLINIAGRAHKWHPNCFKCNICKQPMDRATSCHIYKDKILCRNDYFRLQRDNLVDCARCHWRVGPLDWIRRAGSYIYHLACFNCDICMRQLNTGEQFAINVQERDHIVRLLCRLHFTIETADSNHVTASTDTNQRHQKLNPNQSKNSSNGDQNNHQLTCGQIHGRSINNNQEESQHRHYDLNHQQQTQTTIATTTVPSAPRLQPAQRLTSSSISPSESIESIEVAGKGLVNELSLAAIQHSNTSKHHLHCLSTSTSPASSNSSSSGIVLGGQSMSGTNSTISHNNLPSKSKRVRTTFTEDQLSILQNHFHIDSNPDGQDLERIATITGLSKRVTQVWFQNSRARQKKYMIKRKPSSVSGGGLSLTNHLITSVASNSLQSASTIATQISTPNIQINPGNSTDLIKSRAQQNLSLSMTSNMMTTRESKSNPHFREYQANNRIPQGNTTSNSNDEKDIDQSSDDWSSQISELMQNDDVDDDDVDEENNQSGRIIEGHDDVPQSIDEDHESFH